MIVYTDGSASPNPGPGGFAVIDQQGQPLSLGREAHSTNIRMEAVAIIEALKLADGQPIKIYTDSQFWINVLTQWAPTWVKGHSDNQLNAQADYWANQARQGITLTEAKEKICAN